MTLTWLLLQLLTFCGGIFNTWMVLKQFQVVCLCEKRWHKRSAHLFLKRAHLLPRPHHSTQQPVATKLHHLMAQELE